jgi:organic radical activating enzyme
VSSTRAALIEVFHSIQGEGRFVGEPMAFVRVATCPIRCRYCDTPHSYVAAPDVRVARHGASLAEPNPVEARRAVELALGVAEASPFRAGRGPLRISLTGGEPLVFPGFVAAFGEALGPRGMVHLETAALDPDALATALPALAHLSADYKLPETLAGGDHRAAHVACIAVAAADPRLSIDVKIVLTPDLEPASFERALDDLAPFAARILLILQPVSPHGAVREPAPAALLAACARRAGARGFAFRLVPQTHKALGLD